MKAIFPTGLIPAFNALGNHPADMEAFFDKHVRAAYERLNILPLFLRVRELMCKVVDMHSDSHALFVGHHVPSNTERELTSTLVSTFVDLDRCTWFGSEHFQTAVDLIQDGHNVLIVQNHTSPLDAFIAHALINRTHGSELPVSYMASQVFEYARAASIVTSGFEKFRVFQPKHIDLIRRRNEREAACQMQQQNGVTIHSMNRHARPGGKMFFLYPEKGRSSEMAQPEPLAMGVIPFLKPKNDAGKLYILPVNVTGRNPVIVNKPGTSELDIFFNNMEIGYGQMYTGSPVLFSDIESVVRGLNHSQLISNTLGSAEYAPEDTEKMALAITLLSMVANICPQDKGIYANPLAIEAGQLCQNLGLQPMLSA